MIHYFHDFHWGWRSGGELGGSIGGGEKGVGIAELPLFLCCIFLFCFSPQEHPPFPYNWSIVSDSEGQWKLFCRRSWSWAKEGNDSGSFQSQLKFYIIIISRVPTLVMNYFLVSYSGKIYAAQFLIFLFSYPKSGRRQLQFKNTNIQWNLKRIPQKSDKVHVLHKIPELWEKWRGQERSDWGRRTFFFSFLV